MAHTAEIDPKEAWSGGHSPFRLSYGKIMMWFFLVSDALTFGGLLISYGFIRHKYAEVWPKAEHVFTHFPFIHDHVPLAYVGLMTFILIMSSVTMVLAVEAGHRDVQPARVRGARQGLLLPARASARRARFRDR